MGIEGALSESQNGTSEVSGGPVCWLWAGKTGWSTEEGQAGGGTTQDGGGAGRDYGYKGDKWEHLTAFLFFNIYIYFCVFISWLHCILVAARGIFSCSFCCCSATKSCLSLCDPLDCIMPGSSVLYCPLEFTQNSCPLSR